MQHFSFFTCRSAALPCLSGAGQSPCTSSLAVALFQSTGAFHPFTVSGQINPYSSSARSLQYFCSYCLFSYSCCFFCFFHLPSTRGFNPFTYHYLPIQINLILLNFYFIPAYSSSCSIFSYFCCSPYIYSPQLALSTLFYLLLPLLSLLLFLLTLLFLALLLRIFYILLLTCFGFFSLHLFPFLLLLHFLLIYISFSSSFACSSSLSLPRLLPLASFSPLLYHLTPVHFLISTSSFSLS